MRCVVNAIVAQVPPGEVTGQWEVKVFKSDQANAFALPGGKIGVYRGLLSVAENQDQLATVIGHEIAHVLADHSNERLSTTFATQAGLDLIQAISGAPSSTKEQIFGLLGLGAQYGIILPFNRTQESEADLIGLDLMAKAGFDPRAAIPFWKNMQEQGNGSPPEFLSTHPSGPSRIQDLQARMPQAVELYQKARAQGRRPNCR